MKYKMMETYSMHDKLHISMRGGNVSFFIVIHYSDAG